MIDWRNEAEFVLEVLKKDDDIMFSDDDDEHTMRKKHDEFAAEWGFSYNDILDLDKAIAMFILPRIAYFRCHSSGYPGIFGKTADDGCTIINEDEAVKT